MFINKNETKERKCCPNKVSFTENIFNTFGFCKESNKQIIDNQQYDAKTENTNVHSTIIYKILNQIENHLKFLSCPNADEDDWHNTKTYIKHPNIIYLINYESFLY